jgi:hypothetical protein
VVMESINVVVEDISSNSQKKLMALGDDDEPIQADDKIRVLDDINTEVEVASNKEWDDVQQNVPLSRVKKNNPSDLIIGRQSLERSKKDQRLITRKWSSSIIFRH